MTPEDCYERGRQDRAKSEEFHNPYPKGSPEARQYYEGWCLANFVRWMGKHPELLVWQ